MKRKPIYFYLLLSKKELKSFDDLPDFSEKHKVRYIAIRMFEDEILCKEYPFLNYKNIEQIAKHTFETVIKKTFGSWLEKKINHDIKNFK